MTRSSEKKRVKKSKKIEKKSTKLKEIPKKEEEQVKKRRNFNEDLEVYLSAWKNRTKTEWRFNKGIESWYV